MKCSSHSGRLRVKTRAGQLTDQLRQLAIVAGTRQGAVLDVMHQVEVGIVDQYG